MNSDNQSKQDKSIEEPINRALDTSIENLSPEVRRRLNQARIAATEKNPSPHYYWKTVSALNVFFALAIGWQLLPSPVQIQETSFADVLQEDLEMLDDLEFIYWMAEEEQSATL